MFEKIKIPNTKRTFYIRVGLKNYELNVYDTSNDEEIFIECTGAGLSQPYGKEDLNLLLKDISGMIEEYQSEKKDSTFQMRLTAKQKLLLEKKSSQEGYKTVSDFIKAKCELIER